MSSRARRKGSWDLCLNKIIKTRVEGFEPVEEINRFNKLIVADIVLLRARAQDEQGVGDEGGDSLGDGARQQVDDCHHSVSLALLFNRLVDHVSDHRVNDEHDAHG